MKVTIYFADGSKALFTAATAPAVADGVVTFHGTNEAGVTADWSLNWSTIKMFSVQP